MEDECRYQIVINGQIEGDDLSSMSPVKLVVESCGPETTRFCVRTDQSGLVGLLRHLHNLGVVLLSIRRMDGDEKPADF